ncbi:MAG: hypothetical protein KDC10_09055, partial [Calditrichaeota bacterium]|nr:hypothetical protein [Calditrichota bacterium]
MQPEEIPVRKLSIAVILLFAGCVLAPGVGHAQESGSVVGWGSQVVVAQDELEGFVELAAGSFHSLGLKADGSITAWGHNLAGEC